MTTRDKSNLRMLVVPVCIFGAFSAAYLLKPVNETAGNVPTPAMLTLLDPAEVLARIPTPADGTASGKSVAGAVEQARKYPEKPSVWVVLGDSLRQRLRDSGDPACYDLAETAYRQTLRLQPANVDAMNGMAWLTGGRHLFDASMKWANEALAVNPQSADARGILGDAALELGDYDAALSHYQMMADLRPDLSSWSRGAYLLWITGEKAGGIELMRKAIRAGGPYAENTAWCRAKLATMLIHDCALSEAAEVLEPSLRQRSGNPHILLAAARLASASGEYDVAGQYYRMLLQQGPNHDALAGLGDLRAIQGDKDGAEEFYLEVEALHAAHQASGVHDHMEMAKFLADHDRKPVDALRLAEQHKLTRNVLEADALAWVYLKNGDVNRAAATIKLALSRNTPDAGIFYHAGMIAAAAGDPVSAREYLGKALAMNPRFSLLQAPVAERMLEELSKRQMTSTGLADNPEAKDAR